MFKRFDTEDVVLSSELTTFPTWFDSDNGDTDLLLAAKSCTDDYDQGYYGYSDIYSGIFSSSKYVYNETSSKCMYSVAYANERAASGSLERIIYGQYRALVLGDEESEFRFGAYKAGDSATTASTFYALSVDRSRFREKLDPKTCRFIVQETASSATPSTMTADSASKIMISGSQTYGGVNYLVLAPDMTIGENRTDAGRVYELASCVVNAGTGESSFTYPASASYGFFLPDIGVVLFNADLPVFSNSGSSETITNKFKWFAKCSMQAAKMRSQESVPSNYVFVRVRNGEFNYSMNPTNIDEVGNIRDDVRINSPQTYITTVGLYNDSNDLVAVAKLSKPLVKDFTKEALIRIKVDY